ncbi:MAG: VWA domain-containing protein, partial [Phycisphaeraceae bacterium]|nr:VWA domain-containing protein [Phycisphaeraceae bacterium]
MFGFVNPLFLLALAGLGLPVLIHWLTRARPRQIAYPTFHLLVESGEQKQRLHRLRTWILLLVRALAVAALVLLFSRPIWNEAPAAQETERADRRVVLVIDASASMSAVDQGLTLFNRAVSQAADMLRSLDGQTEAAVVFYGARPRSVLPAVSRNLARLHEALAAARPTREKGNPTAALALAERMLQGPGEVIVYSDFQRTEWAPVDLAMEKSGRWVFQPITPQGVGNVGVVSVDRSPTETVRGEKVEVTCTVFNASPRKASRTVELEMPGLNLSRRVDLKPYAEARARFELELEALGEHV